MEVYPLFLTPVYKDIMWGGERIANQLGREVPTTDFPIAESWEITDRDNGQSIVENGPYAGKTLRELIEMDPAAIVSPKHSADQPFPLLIKIIDAEQRLSLQVHPNEEACRVLEGAEPKTEMWYVLDAKSGAKIFAGLQDSTTKQQFLNKMDSSDVENLLKTYMSRRGDSYFIPAGRIHAIGAGNLIYEVQQNSFTTYRVSDWGRVDQKGNSRELHVDEAIESILFTDRMQPRIPGDCSPVTRNKRTPLVTTCPFFTVEEIRLVDSYCDDTKSESFHTLFATQGSFRISWNGNSIEVGAGRTLLVPAALGGYRLDVDEPTIILKSRL